MGWQKVAKLLLMLQGVRYIQLWQLHLLDMLWKKPEEGEIMKRWVGYLVPKGSRRIIKFILAKIAGFS